MRGRPVSARRPRRDGGPLSQGSSTCGDFDAPARTHRKVIIKVIAHLVPLGTPTALMPVIVEQICLSLSHEMDLAFDDMYG